MGACAAHFRRKKSRQSLPSIDHHDSQIKADIPSRSQKVTFENHPAELSNPTAVVRVVSAAAKDKDKSASCFGRQPSRSTPEFVIQEKQSLSKANKLNDKILHWIDTNDFLLDPPESMLSLAREHDLPRRLTNRQEVEIQKHATRPAFDIHSNESENTQIAF